MYSRTCYEQPLLWAANILWDPLGHSEKLHFVYKGISYEQPPALAYKANFPVSQRWLLIAGSTVIRVYLYQFMICVITFCIYVPQQVGWYLKNPDFPIWLLGSETHLTVLFSQVSKTEYISAVLHVLHDLLSTSNHIDINTFIVGTLFWPRETLAFFFKSPKSAIWKRPQYFQV